MGIARFVYGQTICETREAQSFVGGVTVCETTPAVTAEITGTATASIDEADVVAGGKTIIITLTGDTFVAAGTGPIGSTADTQALIDGISAATSPANGWNDEWRDKEATTAVVRTSDTVATITMSSQATLSGTYDIAAQETIEVTVPAAVLTGGNAVVATPTFTVDAGGGGGGANVNLLRGKVRGGLLLGGKL